MDAHPAEVSAEARLEERAYGLGQRLAAIPPQPPDARAALDLHLRRARGRLFPPEHFVGHAVGLALVRVAGLTDGEFRLRGRPALTAPAAAAAGTSLPVDEVLRWG